MEKYSKPILSQPLADDSDSSTLTVNTEGAVGQLVLRVVNIRQTRNSLLVATTKIRVPVRDSGIVSNHIVGAVLVLVVVVEWCDLVRL